MDTVRNAINWFEIPASDFERARAFYSAIYSQDMPTHTMGPHEMAFFACDRGGVGGAIIKGEGADPGPTGPIVYLNAGQDLTEILNRVPDAGGTIVLPKTRVTEEIGYIAMFIDTEGNRVALHSPE
jgi:predicted enzyme related to lactoylglutathione lyase